MEYYRIESLSRNIQTMSMLLHGNNFCIIGLFVRGKHPFFNESRCWHKTISFNAYILLDRFQGSDYRLRWFVSYFFPTEAYMCREKQSAIVGSENWLLPFRRQIIRWNNADSISDKKIQSIWWDFNLYAKMTLVIELNIRNWEMIIHVASNFLRFLKCT